MYMNPYAEGTNSWCISQLPTLLVGLHPYADGINTADQSSKLTKPKL